MIVRALSKLCLNRGAGEQVEVADREVGVRPSRGVEEDEGGGKGRRDLRREQKQILPSILTHKHVVFHSVYRCFVLTPCERGGDRVTPARGADRV